MFKSFLTFALLIVGGIYTQTIAQEDLNWQMQEFQKAQISQKNIELDQLMAYQIVPKEQQEQQDTQEKKDPENPPEPISDETTPKTEIKAGEESLIQPFETLIQRPDSEQQSNMPLKKPAKIENKENVGEDDSVLGFNFLYFIIHKFKISEILE